MATPEMAAAGAAERFEAGACKGGLSRRAVRNGAAILLIGACVMALGWFFTAGRGDADASSRAVTITGKASGEAPRVGKLAPDFTVTGLDGQPIQLSALRGHPVWINFWATWCPPCRSESPEIEAAAERYRTQGLIVVGIDVGEDAATVRDYVQRAGLTYLIGGDPSTDVAATFRVSGLPTHIFVDADGVVRQIRPGRLGTSAIDAAVATVLHPGN